MRVGGALITVGRLEEGLAALEGTIPVARRLRATNTLALCYHNAADVYLWHGNFPRCREYREQDLVLSEGHGDPARIAFSHAWLGDIAFVQGDWESARRHVQRGMIGRDTLGSNNLTAYAVRCWDDWKPMPGTIHWPSVPWKKHGSLRTTVMMPNCGLQLPNRDSSYFS